ncbi:MAG: SulP family inorganic anion transporter, partial [Flavisolibacter sp.]
SGSQLSVSGPAAGLTAICAAAIVQSGSLEVFFLSVSIAGLLQMLLGILRLGGFTNFIPSSVIKGMLAGIGIILISKQVPFLLGYDQPDFWSSQLFNILTFDHAFQHLGNLYEHSSRGAILIGVISLFLIIIWNKWFSEKRSIFPLSFIIVIISVILSLLFQKFIPYFHLKPTQYVHVPNHIFNQIRLPKFTALFSSTIIWRNAISICFVATLETLLSITAIDKLDPYNRITPQNRELIAQGTGNFMAGFLSGLPITAVIVRSSANAEAGARTRLSAFTHGIWLLLVVLFAVPLVNSIPYSALAVILIRTGYQLAKPKMIYGVYKQGREQFFPFVVTVVAILFTDLLIGVLIGIAYAIYFLIKHTYRAGYSVKETNEGHIKHFTIRLALNVSFLNKKRIMEELDKIPQYSVVEIIGADSVYIDHDVLEIFQDFKTKAAIKHIQLSTKGIPEVNTIELH